MVPTCKVVISTFAPAFWTAILAALIKPSESCECAGIISSPAPIAIVAAAIGILDGSNITLPDLLSRRRAQRSLAHAGKCHQHGVFVPAHYSPFPSTLIVM